MAYGRRTKEAANEAGQAWAIENGFLHPPKVAAFGRAWERIYLLHGNPTEDAANKVAFAELRAPGRRQTENQATFGLRVSVGRCIATARAALAYRETNKATATVATRREPMPTASEDHAVPPAVVGTTSGAALPPSTQPDAMAMVAIVLSNPEARAALVRGLLDAEV